MTIYGYTRVSTVEQTGDRSSLQDQERTIRGAAMMRGDGLPMMFSDPALSGSIPLGSRPEGGKMLAAAKAGDIIIAAKLDRLFRSASDALTIAEELHKRGVGIILCDVGIDPVTSSGPGKLFFTILAAAAEFEKGRILERMSDGRKAKRLRSGHIGGLAPYGYRIVGTGRDAMLEPNPVEQRVIAIARRRREMGLTFRAIADRLQRQNMLNRTGRPFDAMQIKRMLEFAVNGTIAA